MAAENGFKQVVKCLANGSQITCNIVGCEDNCTHNTKYFSEGEDVTVIHFLKTTNYKTVF